MRRWGRRVTPTSEERINTELDPSIYDSGALLGPVVKLSLTMMSLRTVTSALTICVTHHRCAQLLKNGHKCQQASAIRLFLLLYYCVYVCVCVYTSSERVWRRLQCSQILCLSCVQYCCNLRNPCDLSAHRDNAASQKQRIWRVALWLTAADLLYWSSVGEETRYFVQSSPHALTY